MASVNNIHGKIVRFGCISLAILFVSAYANAQSTITGRVYDKQRNPLPEIEIELLDDLYRVMVNGRTKTDGSGRFQFTGLKNGNYTIRVFAFRYDLEDQSIPIEINTQNARGGEGSGYFNQDFFLSPKKGSLAAFETSIIFAQDVPDEARKLFDEGVKELAAQRTLEGLMTLSKAIDIFPNYYMALHRIGRELYAMDRYKDAVPFLLKAVEVNDRSAYTLYYLGNCFYFLGKDFHKASLTALSQAAIMTPASPQVFFALGRTDRAMKNFAEAEKNLLVAKRNAKSLVPEIQRELTQLYANDLKKYGEAANELELYLKATSLSGKDAEEIKSKIADLRSKAGKKGS